MYDTPKQRYAGTALAQLNHLTPPYRTANQTKPFPKKKRKSSTAAGRPMVRTNPDQPSER